MCFRLTSLLALAEGRRPPSFRSNLGDLGKGSKQVHKQDRHSHNRVRRELVVLLDGGRWTVMCDPCARACARVSRVLSRLSPGVFFFTGTGTVRLA